jgi:hypothetical protein
MKGHLHFAQMPDEKNRRKVSSASRHGRFGGKPFTPLDVVHYTTLESASPPATKFVFLDAAIGAYEQGDANVLLVDNLRSDQISLLRHLVSEGSILRDYEVTVSDSWGKVSQHAVPDVIAWHIPHHGLVIEDRHFWKMSVRPAKDTPGPSNRARLRRYRHAAAAVAEREVPTKETQQEQHEDGQGAGDTFSFGALLRRAFMLPTTAMLAPPLIAFYGISMSLAAAALFWFVTQVWSVSPAVTLSEALIGIAGMTLLCLELLLGSLADVRDAGLK